MRTFGVVLILIGALMLVQQFQPALIEPLRAYEPYIRDAFWGITLIAAGLYILAGKVLRRLVLLLYVLYLIVYLVV